MSERKVVDFDHHASGLAERSHAVYAELRARCPVAWTNTNGGYWVVSGYEEVATVARDDLTFSSYKDLPDGPRKGINQPGHAPVRTGMIETDPPRFTQIRRAVNPFFSPAAVEKMKPAIQEFTTFCIDRMIERGSGDLVVDLASPVPALLTMQLLGIPLADWEVYADAMHRGIYTPPDHPEREEVTALTVWVVEQFFATAAQRRADPGDDVFSFFASLEIDGELMPIEEVVGNAFLLLAGGVDTTTGLLGNTFVHLHHDRAARAWLSEDLNRLPHACEEYLRFFTPVQGLARTVMSPCQLGDQDLSVHDRIWMSWASANLDPVAFDDPEELRLDRFPNRHAAFGLGAHRCLGSNVARAVWSTVVREVLTRIPDYEIDEANAMRYPSIGVVNGWAKVPARFTPGTRLGAGLAANL